MGKPQAQPTVWRTSAPVVEKPIVTEGDIYAPLRRLRELYIKRADRAAGRAEKHTAAERFDNASGCYDAAREYLLAASRVAALIPEGWDDVVVAPALTPEQVNALGFGFDVPADATITGVEVSAQ